jgi:hypothetical protein
MSLLYITIETDFPVRHAIEFTSWTGKVNITDNLYSYRDFIYRHDIKKRRVSYRTNDVFKKYAVYKTTAEAMALATGIALGTILGTILLAKLQVFSVGLATPLTTKLILISAGATGAAIASYLSKQIPYKVFSDDPKIHNFNKEFLTSNPQIPWDNLKGNDYDFIDRDNQDKNFRKSLIEIRESAKGFSQNIASGVSNVLDLSGTLIKYSPFIFLGFAGYKYWEKSKQ